MNATNRTPVISARFAPVIRFSVADRRERADVLAAQPKQPRDAVHKIRSRFPHVVTQAPAFAAKEGEVFIPEGRSSVPYITRPCLVHRG